MLQLAAIATGARLMNASLLWRNGTFVYIEKQKLWLYFYCIRDKSFCQTKQEFVTKVAYAAAA